MKIFRFEKFFIIFAVLYSIFILCLTSFDNTLPAPVTGSSENAVPYMININTATADELDALKGIGPALAERIIKHREKNGPFESISELSEVSGVGNSLIEDIKDLIVF